MTPILETNRLKLREMDLTDLDFVAEMLGNSEVMRYWPNCFSREEAQEWISRQQERYRKDGFGYWLLVEKRTETPVGQAGIMKFEIEGSGLLSCLKNPRKGSR